MAKVLVYANRADKLAELVSFARTLGSECLALACGPELPEGFGSSGADATILLKGSSARPEDYSRSIAEFISAENIDIFASVSTPTGREIAAYAAGCLGCPLVSEVQSAAIEGGELLTERMTYGGAVIKRESSPFPCVLTVPAGKYAPASGEAPLTVVPAAEDGRVSLVSTAPIVREGVDITAAEKVVAVGMGFSEKEELGIAYDLAAAIGAEVGCSRSLAEDNHWFSEYIGLSGLQLNPKLYIALGISGQVQHSVGVRGAQLIVAVNRDEKAPIMSACDYGIVGDMFEIVPLLTKAINESK